MLTIRIYCCISLTISSVRILFCCLINSERWRYEELIELNCWAVLKTILLLVLLKLPCQISPSHLCGYLFDKLFIHHVFNASVCSDEGHLITAKVFQLNWIISWHLMSWSLCIHFLCIFQQTWLFTLQWTVSGWFLVYSISLRWNLVTRQLPAWPTPSPLVLPLGLLFCKDKVSFFF